MCQLNKKDRFTFAAKHLGLVSSFCMLIFHLSLRSSKPFSEHDYLWYAVIMGFASTLINGVYCA
jgi:hypothetical protein